MAGEEIKSPGVNHLTTNNPLYNRGVLQTKVVLEPPDSGTDVLRFLAIVALTMVIAYLTFGPVLLVLLVL